MQISQHFKSAKFKFWYVIALLFCSNLAIAAINIIPPTHYKNGKELSNSDISHYIIHSTVSFKEECNDGMVIDVIKMEELSACVKKFKVMTIIKDKGKGKNK